MNFERLATRPPVKGVEAVDAVAPTRFLENARQVLGSAAPTREVLKRDIPGLREIHPGMRRSADPTTDRGRSCMALSNPDHRIWLARRSPAPRLERVSPTRLGARDRRNRPKSPEKLGIAPGRSRSASTVATGWRWGQSRANPSRHEFGQVPAGCCTHACAPESTRPSRRAGSLPPRADDFRGHPTTTSPAQTPTPTPPRSAPGRVSGTSTPPWRPRLHSRPMGLGRSRVVSTMLSPDPRKLLRPRARNSPRGTRSP